MNRVVKCKNDKCEQYFMHTKENMKCPFCYTEYGEVEKKTEETKNKNETTGTSKQTLKHTRKQVW